MGEQDGISKFHTIRWSEICKPIYNGDSGIRDTKSNNLVLLAKTFSRYLQNEELLCFKILKARDCHRKSLWEGEWKNGGSWLWRGFTEALNFIKTNISWIVGNGEKISI